MKNLLKKTQRQCSDFDDRPICDIYDNLYADTEENNNTYDVNNLKKLKIKRNNEKPRENTVDYSDI